MDEQAKEKIKQQLTERFPKCKFMGEHLSFVVDGAVVSMSRDDLATVCAIVTSGLRSLAQRGLVEMEGLSDTQADMFIDFLMAMPEALKQIKGEGAADAGDGEVKAA